MPDLRIFRADLQNPVHQDAIFTLLNHYIEDDMGGGTAHTADKKAVLINGLKDLPTSFVVLAQFKEEFAGLATCFINFGTFALKRFLNVHDIVVLDKFRGKGIGGNMLEFIDKHAREQQFAKLTLEVREDNKRAMQVYQKFGFNDCNPRMHYWEKKLL